MHAIPTRPSRVLPIAAAMFPLVAFAGAARADIFQWEYINPADPSQGKQQSTTLAPDGAGVDAAPGAKLRGRNLTMAYLIGADLSGADFSMCSGFICFPNGPVHLTDADLSHANLRNANFEYAVLTDANLSQTDLSAASLYAATLTGVEFTGAEVRGANLGSTGITPAQLYSTASYQAHDLTGIGLGGNDLNGSNFAGQNLTDAYFLHATLVGTDFSQAELSNAHFDQTTLTDADFTGAEVRGAGFLRYDDGGQFVGGITLAQLYSTASYQAHDLSGIGLLQNDLAGANFVGQNLTNARFAGATLTGVDFTDAQVQGADVGGLTLTQLYSTASYQAHDLTGSVLGGDLSGGNFVGQNLTNAIVGGTLTDADFTDAEIRGASFDRSYAGTGITLAQLYSTASYQAHDLIGINLIFNNLAGGNFAGQNLANADFYRATLTGADFREANLTNAYLSGATLTDADLTAADARGALYLATAIATNLIRPYGHVDGLDLNVGGLLIVRDYDGDIHPISHGGVVTEILSPIPITVDQHLTMGPAGTLRMVFEADAWNSTISFAPGIPVTLGGTLELTFAADVNLASQVGRTFDLFDWTGVSPTGNFAISSPYAWDLSNLYTTGEVTLAAVPEPSCLALAAVGVFGFALFRRRKIS